MARLQFEGSHVEGLTVYRAPFGRNVEPPTGDDAIVGRIYLTAEGTWRFRTGPYKYQDFGHVGQAMQAAFDAAN